MSGKIEISREQLEYWCVMLRNGLPETVESMIQTVIAAPVVERQPDAYMTVHPNGMKALFFPSANIESYPLDRPLYASPPAPVADDMVRLLTRARIYARGEFRDEIDACLKELNQ